MGVWSYSNSSMLDAAGMVQLPTKRARSRYRPTRFRAEALPETEIATRLGRVRPVNVEPVPSEEQALCDATMAKHHALGFRRAFGAPLAAGPCDTGIRRGTRNRGEPRTKVRPAGDTAEGGNGMITAEQQLNEMRSPHWAAIRDAARGLSSLPCGIPRFLDGKMAG